MNVGLQTHIRGWCDPAILREVRAFGWTMARIDAQAHHGVTVEAACEWIADARAADLIPYVIVSDAEQIRELREAGVEALQVELRNECNLEGPDPVTYRHLLDTAALAAHACGYQLHAPVISNLDHKSLTYAREVGQVPAGVHGSFHWYPHGSDPHTPHPSFYSREHEVHAWLESFGYGIWGVSESGFHTARQPRYTGWRKNLPIYTRWSDEDVLRHVQHELAFWERMGAAFWVLYQMNDGPDDTPGHRFGIRRMDGSWKPVASVLATT